MARPIWDARTAIWVVIAIVSLTACGFVVWMGEQWQARNRAERQQKESEIAK